MGLYEELRAKYPVFNYNGYEIDQNGENVVIQYFFEIEGLSEFSPSWTFKLPGKDFRADSTFENIVFNLGMVELISYWKITCSPTVNIKCGGKLDDEQTNWWKKLYFNGLGECFYLNGITDNADRFMNINSFGCKAFELNTKPLGEGCLVPIGGGKDSIVSLGVLEQNRDKNYCYIINPRGATLNTVKTAGYDDRLICAHRTLDKRMLELNKKVFINGHTPFSAIVAFSATLAAYINGVKYIALSNESSANESTVAGSYVNHQYSKSFEFEQDFHKYEEKYIRSGTYYFSLLRPLSEYQIAGLFARDKRFYEVFRSCNAGSKEDKWCGNCPKCLFVYIIMSPFLSPSDLEKIFGYNLYENRELLENFQKLIGFLAEKPFECVGGRDEINFALCEAVKKYEKLPFLLEFYVGTDIYSQYKDRKNPYGRYYDRINLLPEKFEKMLMQTLGSETDD